MCVCEWVCEHSHGAQTMGVRIHVSMVLVTGMNVGVHVMASESQPRQADEQEKWPGNKR